MDNKKNGIPKLRFPGFTGAWEQRKLGEVADIVGGGTPSTKVKEYWNGNINWYSPIEIGTSIYASESVKKITQLGLEKSSAKLLPKGTVLFTSRAGIGNTAILMKEATTNQGFQSIVPKKGVLNSYFIFTETPFLKRYGEINGAGSTFVEVSGKQMSKMPLLLPSFDEQLKIGNFFKQLDHLITLHQRKLEHLQEQKKGLLQKMFPKNGETVPEVRFPGFTDAWEQRKLGEILKERKERSSIGELISVTINNGVVKADSLERKDNSSSDKSNYKVVCKGDIAYNSMRMWQGASGYSPYNGILSPAYTVLIPTEKVDSKFISYMFKKEKMLQQFQKYSQGLTSDTWNLKYPMLKDIPVLFPKIDEQVSIRKHLDNISSLIALHQRKLDHLELMKKGLLQQMFV